MRTDLVDPTQMPEVVVEQFLAQFLRAPGNSRLLDVYSLTCQTEIIPMLYDVWATAKEVSTPGDAKSIIQVFLFRWNVDTGASPDLAGWELFAADLEELCLGVNTYLQTNELTQEQLQTGMRVQQFFSAIRGANPGAISIPRGWLDLMAYVSGTKKLERCVAPDCGRLLSISNDDAVLSGTVYGYHAQNCQDHHSQVPATNGQPQTAPPAGEPPAQEAVAEPEVVEIPLEEAPEDETGA